jgi:hypothetical protein
MRYWWLIIALLLSIGLNVGILATIAARKGDPTSEPRGPNLPPIANPGKDPLPLLPRLADRLGLEGEERRKFLDLQWNLYQETSRHRLQLGEVHREIRRELTRSEPDRQQVDKLLSESARIYLALERSLVSNVLATRELLDPEQEKQYMVLIGRLRIAGPATGLSGPGPGPGADRPALQQRREGPGNEEMRRLMEERMEQRRLRQERMQERFPGRRFPNRPRRFGEEPRRERPQDQEPPP